MKQLKGILFVLSKKAEDTSVLEKSNPLAHIIRSTVSTLLGYSEVPEKWVKVLAVDEDYANGLLWNAWNDNYKAINSLLKEHEEIKKNVTKYNFLPDSDEMDKLIQQFNEITANLESSFQEQDDLYQSIIKSTQIKQEAKTDYENFGWHQSGIIIDGKSELAKFPEELPAELFEGKAENDIITFVLNEDIEFTFTLKEKLYGFDENQFFKDDIPYNEGIKLDASKLYETPQLKKKLSIPLPVKIALAALGGLGIIALIAGCRRL